MTDTRLALAKYLAIHGVKLVHTWRTGTGAGSPLSGTRGGVAASANRDTGERWNAMVEWPYDPTRKKPLPTERHATGVGSDPCSATIAGCDRIAMGGFRLRLFVLSEVL